MLDGMPPFLDEEAFGYLPRNKVVRAPDRQPGRAARRAGPRRRRRAPAHRACARATSSSSRRAPSPATSSTINRIINALTERGVRVITDRDRLVHVSGHPRRDELREMYGWVKPQIAIPGPWRGDAPCAPTPTSPASSASRRCSTVEDGDHDAARAGPGRADRRDRGRPALQGRPASSPTSRASASPSGAGCPSPAMSRFRSSSTSSGEQVGRPATST